METDQGESGACGCSETINERNERQEGGRELKSKNISFSAASLDWDGEAGIQRGVIAPTVIAGHSVSLGSPARAELCPHAKGGRVQSQSQAGRQHSTVPVLCVWRGWSDLTAHLLHWVAASVPTGGWGARLCSAAECWVVTVVWDVQDASEESLLLMSRDRLDQCCPEFAEFLQAQ